MNLNYIKDMHWATATITKRITLNKQVLITENRQTIFLQKSLLIHID